MPAQHGVTAATHLINMTNVEASTGSIHYCMYMQISVWHLGAGIYGSLQSILLLITVQYLPHFSSSHTYAVFSQLPQFHFHILYLVHPLISLLSDEI